ncbi:MAG: hypothetical protein IJ083_14165 [Clostridia bacterium]|nr:hypothetical protein [Clostridia bacterium]
MKKLSVGAWFTLCAAILAILAFVMYTVNVNGEGYYKAAAVANLPLAVWGAVACLVCAVVLHIVADNKAIEILGGLLRIAAPALLGYALMNLIGGRVDGLGYIYFSNADVAREVQTAANLGSAQTAIWSMAVLGVATLVAVVAAFFTMRKKAKA